ncbi:MAG: nucleotidyltransferase domain-containing protein, partial [Clostridiales bacterium]|nr:nucleotidyltransferase domain-containing protein [Clostridiales bacterium]
MDCEYAGDVSGLECALSRMTEAVCGLLVGCRPSVYLYGSAVSGDFRLGWSDLDVLVLTREPIPPSAAEALVPLRQTMTAAEPDNVYYRLFEGGMLPLRNLLSAEPTRAVYWG